MGRVGTMMMRAEVGGWEQSRHYAAFRSSPSSRVPFGRQAVAMCSGTIETQRFPGTAPTLTKYRFCRGNWKGCLRQFPSLDPR